MTRFRLELRCLGTSSAGRCARRGSGVWTDAGEGGGPGRSRPVVAGAADLSGHSVETGHEPLIGLIVLKIYGVKLAEFKPLTGPSTRGRARPRAPSGLCPVRGVK